VIWVKVINDDGGQACHAIIIDHRYISIERKEVLVEGLGLIVYRKDRSSYKFLSSGWIQKTPLIGRRNDWAKC
jgi:hypothetical protein